MYRERREVRAVKDKVLVDELPEYPEDCEFCLGHLYDSVYECKFIDPDCPIPGSPMACILSLHGHCNRLAVV